MNARTRFKIATAFMLSSGLSLLVVLFCVMMLVRTRSKVVQERQKLIEERQELIMKRGQLITNLVEELKAR